MEHTKTRSTASIERAISRLCSNFQNPKPDKLLDLIDLFDREFKTEIEEKWKDENCSDGERLKGMVTVRINIAHQKTKSSDVTVTKIEEFFQLYKQIVTMIHDRFCP